VTKRWSAELELIGAGGEPVDLWRTLASHGVADLPPNVIDEDARTLETTLALPRGRARTIRISAGRPGFALVESERVGARDALLLADAARNILRLDADLAPFYDVARADPDLAWAAEGAGRMLRSPTVFEDVVKTICTTNIAWSGTVRIVSALVGELGVQSAGGHGRAFPTPAAMAAAPEAFYADVARAGYRGAYLRALAADVAGGALDLEALRTTSSQELSDTAVAERLLALPGVGPYAAAHIMMLLGRHSLLILDSWTRPKWARLNGRKAKDATIVRRFRRYGDYAGLAFWLRLTEDWA
jgi:3-methyladenine DNA glycosylase/8-oxoguanine DNA glycosylase